MRTGAVDRDAIEINAQGRPVNGKILQSNGNAKSTGCLPLREVENRPMRAAGIDEYDGDNDDGDD